MASDDETTAAKIFQDQSGFRYETDVFQGKIFDLVKAIAKLLVLFYVIYNELSDEWGMVVNIYFLLCHLHIIFKFSPLIIVINGSKNQKDKTYL